MKPSALPTEIARSLLSLTASVMLAAPAHATARHAVATPSWQPRTVTAKEIRRRLVGKVISDSAHWHYYLKPNGAIDAEELSRSRKGRWHLEGDRLCIVIYGGAQPDECWDVTEKDHKLMFGTNGEVTYWVNVKSPPL
jgi:hypothetical protein